MKTAALLGPLAFLVPLAATVTVTGTAKAQGTVTFGGGASADTNTGANANANANATGATGASGAREAAAAPVEGDKEAKEWQERDRKLNEATTLTGGVGLLHTQHAQGGAAGQFHLDFTTEYFSAGFLCSSEFPCRDPRNSTGSITNDPGTDHFGGRLRLSVQVLKWLEPYLATSAFANSNPANRPSLLQVLGDSTLGAKVHGQLSNVFSVGGALELWLVNGTGSVGLDGAGTSAKFRGLATADLRGMQKQIPLRFSVNTTYVLDNTAEVIADTERARGAPVTRIERFGLNINRVDHFDIHLGAELFVAQEKVRPFIEYQLAIPINRQDYRCQLSNASRDKCLATDAFAPSSFTLGARFFPWKRGFNLLAAFDIGVTGTGTFIEEVRPTPPWMLYLGAGWAFDTQDRPPIIKEQRVDAPVHQTGRRIRGFVHEEGRAEGISGAIISWDNHPELTSLYTGTDGRFTTHELPEGPYAFGVRADGFKPGQCTTTIVRSGPPAGPPPMTPGAPPPTPPPSGGGDVQVDCPLVSLPRVGVIVGKVKDADSGAPVANVAIKVVDAGKKELTATADGSGSFRFDQVTPGQAEVTGDVDGYLTLTDKFEIKPRQDNTIDILMRKKPKNPQVQVSGKEIIIKQQIQFAVDSAVILPESSGLLNEIADVIQKNPKIRKVEVQGHTDNTGTPAGNMKLSEDRASSVVAWLTSHGVASDRLVPHGYGDTKPLVPNVTSAFKQKNRRVQFIILEREGGGPTAATGGASVPSPSIGAPALGGPAVSPAKTTPSKGLPEPKLPPGF